MSLSPSSEVFRVLVVDDNVAIHDDFRKVLGRPAPAGGDLDALEQDLFGSAQPAAASTLETYELDSAYQGNEAIELVSRSLEQGRPYSVAFVDVRMPPGLDGIQTISEIWKIDPNIQAVICTAYSDHTWNDIIRSLGHSDGLLVLKKPFDPLEAQQAAHALARKWLLSDQVRKRLTDLESLVSARTGQLELANQDLKNEILQRAQAQNDLRHLATHDSLTGLPNRILLKDRMSTALSRARRNGTLVAVMLLDLDNFKEVNDAHGHAAGDEVLKGIAERLRSSARACDTVTRMGGDEFVVVLEELSEPEQAAIVAERMLEACSKPIAALGNEFRTPPSIGIAIYPTDCSDPESLLKGADLAMYQAKSAGRATFRFYAEGLFSSAIKKLALRSQLGTALARNELTLWYQPLLDLRTGAVSGMEALLRWQHPELGLVPPMQFVPLAEATGLIVPIGAWVVNAACRQLAEWRRQGASELTVAVNVSPRQLNSPDFVDVVRGALQAAGLDGSALEIEITESAATDDTERAAVVLKQLAREGVRIAIDDFGSGYSSFARLKELPIHTLKIDRSLVDNLERDPRDAMIVSAIVSVARALKLNVVAEGVETEEQLERLSHLDAPERVELCCDRVQGFLLSKPLPREAASTYLRTNRKPPHVLEPTGT